LGDAAFPRFAQIHLCEKLVTESDVSTYKIQKNVNKKKDNGRTLIISTAEKNTKMRSGTAIESTAKL
jgi:hypothetical protein